MTEPDFKRPTLKTIAELTGLSLSTVSLSLRHGSNLKQETRDKVAQAAKQIGYVPNRAGVRLRTGRTNVLALALATDTHIIDYTRLLIQGIGSYIHGSKYQLHVIPEFEKQDALAMVSYILENKAADGIILTHTSAQDPRVKLLMKRQFPFVSHGRTEFETPHAYHDFNAERYIALAVQRLAAKQRRKLILALVDNGTTNFMHITTGFAKAISEAAVEGTIVKSRTSLDTTSQARQFAQSLADRQNSFDAIVCNNELTALAIIAGLADKGVALGRDYDMVCKQTTDILPMLHPMIDTVSEDLAATGQQLGKLLVARIEGEPVESLQTLYEPISHWRSDL